MDCCEKTVALPLGIFVPFRGTAMTTHSDATAQTAFTVTLPDDDLTENIMLTLLGEHTSSTIRIAFQIPLMITRRSDDSPDYSVHSGSESWMNDEDSDIEVTAVANGSSGVDITITDASGDAGQIDWEYQIWTLDQLKHSSSSAQFLLDIYTGSAGAWSLRTISSSVTNVARVRRSSDNAEMDITEIGITDGTLTSFTGSGDGFVTTLYDQSGNGRDMSQSVANNQPQLVISGAVNTLNGLPSILFDPTSNPKFFKTSSLPMSTWIGASYQNLISHVMQINGSIQTIPMAQGNGSNPAFNLIYYTISAGDIFYDTGNNGTRRTASLHPVGFENNQRHMMMFSDGSNGTIDIDGGLFTTNAVSGSPVISGSSSLYLGVFADGVTQPFDGEMQEFIIYNTDESLNVSGIESNTNTHYSIY